MNQPQIQDPWNQADRSAIRKQIGHQLFADLVDDNHNHRQRQQGAALNGSCCHSRITRHHRIKTATTPVEAQSASWMGNGPTL